MPSMELNIRLELTILRSRPELDSRVGHLTESSRHPWILNSSLTNKETKVQKDSAVSSGHKAVKSPSQAFSVQVRVLACPRRSSVSSLQHGNTQLPQLTARGGDIRGEKLKSPPYVKSCVPIRGAEASIRVLFML